MKTLKEYVNKKRVEKATELLKSTELSMEEIAQKTGFSSSVPKSDQVPQLT